MPFHAITRYTASNISIAELRGFMCVCVFVCWVATRDRGLTMDKPHVVVLLRRMRREERLRLLVGSLFSNFVHLTMYLATQTMSSYVL